MKKLRFGIVGTGGIAHRFANAIKNVPEAELVAVASRKQETADSFGDEFDIPLRFSSYEAMAQSHDIDAAYIAVPHSGHMPCACLMMNAGKHVLCEKPIAVNLREAKEMFECAKKNNVFLMEAMWARLVPGTVKLIELVEGGLIGDVLGVEGKFCYSMDEDELDHHVFKPCHGGGSLLDVGVYGLNFASWFLGRDVEHISAEASLFGGVDSHTCMLLKYKSGAIADISSAILLKKPNEGAIYGTKGYIKLEHFYAPEKLEIHIYDVNDKILDLPYRGNGFEEQISHMCACIADGLTQSPVNTPEQTLFITGQMDYIRSKINVKYPQDI